MSSWGEPRLIETVYSVDERGTFSKPLPPKDLGFDFPVREIFWTTSSLGVIRGMHFQTEPDPIAKLVWVSSGSIFDVLVDLREGDTFGAVSTWSLDAAHGAVLFVPRGFAHGFQSLEDATTVNYAVDGLYSAATDAGVLWSSVEVEWPLPVSVISPRDLTHGSVADFAPRFGRGL